MKRIRVLVVDDSLFMRAAIRRVLEKDPRLEVVGEARDGRHAVEQVEALRPDVCTMDFNMPVLDGIGAVREIMQRRPTPIVMLSAHTREGARETFEALAAGAVDFVTKPTGEVSAQLASVAAELVQKVCDAAAAVPRAASAAAPPPPPARISAVRAVGPGLLLGSKLAVVAISTGGPAALGRLLPALPADTSVAIVVVQHLPGGFTAALAERLDAQSAIRVREAETGDLPGPGLALIAPGDRHLEFAPDGAVVLTDAPPIAGLRPAADVTMRSAAQVFGRRAVGVVMTGMGKDGTEGLRSIKQAGGATLAQDEASSVIYGMPRSAVEAGLVDRVVPLDGMADAIRRA